MREAMRNADRMAKRLRAEREGTGTVTADRTQ
jgi:hypothetical protein